MMGSLRRSANVDFNAKRPVVRALAGAGGSEQLGVQFLQRAEIHRILLLQGFGRRLGAGQGQAGEPD